MPAVTNVLVVGDNHVGKTSLVHYLKYDRPLQHPSSTVGVEFTTMRIDGRTFHVWDVEGLHTLSLIDKKRFQHVFVVCNAREPDTVEPYVEAVKHNNNLVTLVANKSEDPAAQPRGYLCTSALLGTNVNELRMRLVRSQLND